MVNFLRGSRQFGRSLLGAGFLAAACHSAQAVDKAVTPSTEYRDRVRVAETVQPLGEAPFGEQLNLYRGGLSFRQQDISYPGTGPEISLSRSFTIGGSSARATGLYDLADWELSIPRIQVVVPGDRLSLHGSWLVEGANGLARCSGFDHVSPAPFAVLGAQEWSSGYQLITSDGTSRTLLRRTAENTIAPSAGSYGIVTADHWMVGCLPNTANGMPGEAFLALAPDGTRIWFNQLVYGPALQTLVTEIGGGSGIVASSPHGGNASTPSLAPGGGKAFFPRKLAYMYATRIEDRFGNALTFAYANGKLASINATDGRALTLAWNSNGTLASIVMQPLAANKRTWTYQYASGTLSGVVLPDKTTWSFAMSGTDRLDPDLVLSDVGACGNRSGFSNALAAVNATATITHPSGLVGRFDIGLASFSRSYVPTQCDALGTSESNPTVYTGYSLLQKSFSGPGIATRSWQYGYSNTRASSLAECAAGPCTDTSYVEVLAPDGFITRYTHSNRWDASEGKLRTIVRGLGAWHQPNPTGPESVSETYAAPNLGPFPSRLGYLPTWGVANNAPEEQLSPSLQTRLSRQGVDFVRTTNAFDRYGAPTSVTRASTGGAAGNFSRTEVTTYRNDLAKWVLGQVETVTDAAPGSGKVMRRTEYDAVSLLPVRRYAFEALQQSLGYASDGTLATVTDGRGNVTRLSGWTRGLPSSIAFPTGFGTSAVIDPVGLMTSVTDELGSTTCYDYDAAGRLTKVTYTDESRAGACSNARWNTTGRSVGPVAIAEYGLAPGHWRQTVQTGGAVTTTWYDALMQPVLTLSEDTANAGSRSFVVTRYDGMGRKTFTSYPVGSLGSINDALTGVRTTYDVLGRVTQVQQDDGATPGAAVLNTNTTYLSGFRTQVTNPRGYATTTSYQAYDEPSTDLPRLIAMPEGVTTEIGRQPTLGKTTYIQRSGFYQGGWLGQTRSYVYDANERLCQTIEPETGTTIVDYDLAGNVAWTADGQAASGTSAASCAADRAATPVAARSVRTLDAMNRVTLLTTPNNDANVSTLYEPDGLVKSLTALSAYTGAQVVTDYRYNRRRLLVAEDSSQPGWYLTTIGYDYDANGHASSLTYPNLQQVTYAPDALGRPTQVGSYATGIGYYPNGAISGFTYGNGLVRTMTQNARRLPATSVDKRPNNSVIAISDTLTYDANGNVLAIADGAQAGLTNRAMAYDGLDRLTSVSSPGQWGSATYSYDPIDNLRSADIDGTAARHYRYNYFVNNVLANITTPAGATVFTFAFDGRGNLFSKNDQIYDFDSGNRLTSVLGKENYRYDGLGRRVYAADTVAMLWQYSQDGRELWASDARRGQNRINIYLGNTVLATRTTDWGSGAVNVRYLHTDALGSPVAESDASGAIVKRNSYEPYGAQYGANNIDGIGYTGHVMDQASGLTYMQQRYYDPQLGLFLSVDQVPSDPQTGQNFNAYRYANSNPFRFLDRDGRRPGNICDSGGTGCETVLGSGLGKEQEKYVVGELRRQGIEVLEQVKLTFQDASGKTVNGFADYVARVGDRLLVGEVKAGLFSKFSGNQKIVYSAIHTGSVRVVSSAVAERLGLSADRLLNGKTTELAVHALEGGRAWRQAARMFPQALRVGGKVLGTVMKAGDLPLLFLSTEAFDVHAATMDTVPFASKMNSIEIAQ